MLSDKYDTFYKMCEDFYITKVIVEYNQITFYLDKPDTAEEFLDVVKNTFNQGGFLDTDYAYYWGNTVRVKTMSKYMFRACVYASEMVYLPLILTNDDSQGYDAPELIQVRIWDRENVMLQNTEGLSELPFTTAENIMGLREAVAKRNTYDSYTFGLVDNMNNLSGASVENSLLKTILYPYPLENYGVVYQAALHFYDYYTDNQMHVDMGTFIFNPNFLQKGHTIALCTSMTLEFGSTLAPTYLSLTLQVGDTTSYFEIVGYYKDNEEIGYSYCGKNFFLQLTPIAFARPYTSEV
jgi:hypothetical protein